MSNPWHSSPSEVDLLSWFTSHLVPVLFGGMATTFGAAVTIITAEDTGDFVRGGVFVVVMAVAFGSIVWLSPSRRSPRKAGITFIPITIGWVAMTLSLTNEWGTTSPIELHWSPIMLALLIASLTPYLSAFRILIVGGVSTVFLVGVTAIGFTIEPHPSYWPFPLALILGSGMALIATAAASTFCYQVVARTMRWATTAAGEALSSGVLGEAARRRILRAELASMSARSLPLLERVTESGVVTAEDREEARVLSEKLRVELVERSNRSWLESHTLRMNLTVVDHERLAEQLNPNQRSAILGLLRATIGELPTKSARPVIELRRERDGGIAVAISADHALPDGHKLTLLAPYYVSLVAAVDDVQWQSGKKLRLSFRVPPRTPTSR